MCGSKRGDVGREKGSGKKKEGRMDRGMARETERHRESRRGGERKRNEGEDLLIYI